MAGKAVRKKKGTPIRIITDPHDAARAAQLRHDTDDRPGITRHAAGKGFTYRGPDGKVIRDRATLDRIAALVIPPAWTQVWISPYANGHIQATGRDARQRKQYKYHARWREVRDETKYGRMLMFGAALPAIRARVNQDLSRRALDRERVLATVVRLLETTYMRVGNDEYARTNGSFGITTLLDDHVTVTGGKIRFNFRGKSGKTHQINVTDRRLASLVKRCRDLPGQDLFQYLDDQGNPHPISSTEVNAYICEISGDHFTAKDFRTWAGTLLAAAQIAGMEQVGSATKSKAAATAAVKAVAAQLGNTVAVCRKCYIHPQVLRAFEDAALFEAWSQAVAGKSDDATLTAHEGALLRYLRAGAAA